MTVAYDIGVKIVRIFCTNDKETVIFERNFMIEYFTFELAVQTAKKALKWEVNNRLILT